MILISSNGGLETAMESILTTGECNPQLAALPVPTTTCPDLSGLQVRSASMSAIERPSSDNPFSTTTNHSEQEPIAGAPQRNTPLNGHLGVSPVPGAAGRSFGSMFYPSTLQPFSDQLVTGGVSTSGPLFPNTTGCIPAHQHEFITQRHAQTPPLPAVPSFYGSTDAFDIISPPTDNGNPFIVSPPQGWASTFPPAASQRSLYDRTDSFPRPDPVPARIGLIQPPSFVPNQIGKQVDKSAIMALFNCPHLAPAPQSSISAGIASSESSSGLVHSGEMQAMTPPNVPSPVGPQAGNRSPFSSTIIHASGTRSATVGTSGSSREAPRHVSQDSMDLTTYTSGRHSPELFASLSARSARSAR